MRTRYLLIIAGGFCYKIRGGGVKTKKRNGRKLVRKTVHKGRGKTNPLYGGVRHHCGGKKKEFDELKEKIGTVICITFQGTNAAGCVK